MIRIEGIEVIAARLQALPRTGVRRNTRRPHRNNPQFKTNNRANRGSEERR
jgi:hypothetical protein